MSLRSSAVVLVNFSSKCVGESGGRFCLKGEGPRRRKTQCVRNDMGSIFRADENRVLLTHIARQQLVALSHPGLQLPLRWRQLHRWWCRRIFDSLVRGLSNERCFGTLYTRMYVTYLKLNIQANGHTPLLPRHVVPGERFAV